MYNQYELKYYYRRHVFEDVLRNCTSCLWYTSIFGMNIQMSLVKKRALHLYGIVFLVKKRAHETVARKINRAN
jgi:hypothetical protein